MNEAVSSHALQVKHETGYSRTHLRNADTDSSYYPQSLNISTARWADRAGAAATQAYSPPPEPSRTRSSARWLRAAAAARRAPRAAEMRPKSRHGQQCRRELPSALAASWAIFLAPNAAAGAAACFASVQTPALGDHQALRHLSWGRQNPVRTEGKVLPVSLTGRILAL